MTLRKLAAQTLSPGYDQPFGGKHVLLFGDLAQVPAVVRTADDFSESSEQFFASLPYSSFATLSLSIIMRQDPGQEQLLQLLDEVRGSIRLSHASLSAARFHPGQIEAAVDTVDAFVGHDSASGMVIAFTNNRVSRYNELIISRRAAALQVTPLLTTPSSSSQTLAVTARLSVYQVIPPHMAFAVPLLWHLNRSVASSSVHSVPGTLTLSYPFRSLSRPEPG